MSADLPLPPGRPDARADAAGAPSDNAFARRVLQRARQLGITKKALAQQAGLSRQTLDNLLGQAPSVDRVLPSVRTLLCLAVALKVHPYWLTDALMEQVGVSPHLATLMKGERAGFVEDVSCPDGAVVAPGEHFVKVWMAQNLGVAHLGLHQLRCWDDHVTPRATDAQGRPIEVQRLVPDVQAIDFPGLASGQPLDSGAVFTMTVGFTAPSRPGPAMSYWLATNRDGQPTFSESTGLWVVVWVEPDPAIRRAMPAASIRLPDHLATNGVRPG